MSLIMMMMVNINYIHHQILVITNYNLGTMPAPAVFFPEMEESSAPNMVYDFPSE